MLRPKSCCVGGTLFVGVGSKNGRVKHNHEPIAPRPSSLSANAPGHTGISIPARDEGGAQVEYIAVRSAMLLACPRKDITRQNFQFACVPMTVRVGRKHPRGVVGVMRVEPRGQPKCLLAELLRRIIDSAKVNPSVPRRRFRCNGPFGMKNATGFGISDHDPVKASRQPRA
jgi:hypothetical protein